MTGTVPRGLAGPVAAILLSFIGTGGFLILPLLVGAAAGDLQLTEAQVGLLATAVMGGSALSSALALLWIRRVNWRWAAAFSVLAIAVGHAGCLLSGDAAAVTGWLLLTGIGGGAVYSIALTVLADESRAARYFGFSVAAQVAFQVAGMLVLPQFTGEYGLDAVVGLLLALDLIGVAIVPLLPARGHLAPTVVNGPLMPGVPALLALVGCILFFFNVGVVWAYIERMASGAGMSPDAIGVSLAIGVAFGIPGALAASWCGNRFGHFNPLLVGSVIMLTAVGILSWRLTEAAYVTALALYNLSWNFLLSFQYAAVSAVDDNGRSVAVAPAFHGFGAALGPVVAALFVTRDSYMAVPILATLGIAGSLLLFGIALSTARSRAPAPGAASGDRILANQQT